jgi:pimeloyl-ACP methyl ester carboxylesterase
MPADIWEHQIRHFAARWRVVAMDPRSQGESDKPTEGHYPERRAQDIKEVVDQLKLAPVVLVGWSLGVTESLTYVEQFGASTLRAVVLVEGRGDWRPVLAKLDRPTLYVYAPRMKAQAAMLKAALPAARLELFAQAGHALFVDEAARFNRLLEEFLDAAR